MRSAALCKIFDAHIFRKNSWVMDPATDTYYRWLTIIAGPVFYNLMMLITRSETDSSFCD